jgi:hypothetical protein
LHWMESAAEDADPVMMGRSDDSGCAGRNSWQGLAGRGDGGQVMGYRRTGTVAEFTHRSKSSCILELSTGSANANRFGPVCSIGDLAM